MVPEFLINAYILSTLLKQGDVTQVTLRHVMLIPYEAYLTGWPSKSCENKHIFMVGLYHLTSYSS